MVVKVHYFRLIITFENWSVYRLATVSFMRWPEIPALYPTTRDYPVHECVFVAQRVISLLGVSLLTSAERAKVVACPWYFVGKQLLKRHKTLKYQESKMGIRAGVKYCKPQLKASQLTLLLLIPPCSNEFARNYKYIRTSYAT